MLLEIELYEARTRLSQDHALKSESEGDFADVARQTSETEMSAAWQPELLSKIESALLRVRTASYGTCLACGEAISPKRLAALPWASLCVQCQANAEQKSA